ncbi:MAG TPA: type II toxin-antitoxin system death-on-curing family toxin [Phycisphaerae bacterium]|jgi:death-on-curing protein
MSPIFLTLDEAVEIHRDQIERYGGSAGVRDFGLLQSALAMPAAGFDGEYLHADLFEMAAAYLFHIVQNHPFVDGNKRAGAVAAIVFLCLNGISLQVAEEEFEELVLGVAQGHINKPAIADFFRAHARQE